MSKTPPQWSRTTPMLGSDKDDGCRDKEIFLDIHLIGGVHSCLKRS
jgi:hypothetical protein